MTTIDIASIPEEVLTVREKILETEERLGSLFLERDEEIRALALGLLSKQHVLFLGPPGTAKSRLIELWCQALDLTFFRRQLHQFTDPSEIFGPLDLPALKESGIYRRKLEGKAACCQVFYADEVFKAREILNTMLSLMEERVFDNDGDVVITPLISMIGSSNELPSKDDNLQAFYDRFLIRMEMEYVDDATTFSKLMAIDNPVWVGPPVISNEELEQAHAEIDTLALVPATIESLTILWDSLREEGRRPSDRRWRQLIKVMAAHSWLEGMPNISPSSIKVAEHILWDEPKDKNMIKRIVLTSINAKEARAREIWEAAERERQDLGNDPRSIDIMRAVEVAQSLDGMLSDFDDLGSDPAIKNYRTKVEAIRTKIMSDVATKRN